MNASAYRNITQAQMKNVDSIRTGTFPEFQVNIFLPVGPISLYVPLCNALNPQDSSIDSDVYFS